jgi:hypothetical protein
MFISLYSRCSSEEVEEPSDHHEITSSSSSLKEVLGELQTTNDVTKCPEPDIVCAEMLGESIISVDIIENPEEIVILPSSVKSPNSQNLDDKSITDESSDNQSANLTNSPSASPITDIEDDEDDEVTFSKTDNTNKPETAPQIPPFFTSLPQRSHARNFSIPVVNCSTPVVSLMQLGRKTVESNDPLKCSDCDFTTRSAPAMIRHTIEEHGIRTFACTQCEFSATSAISIMEHNYTEHKVPTQPKLVTCSKCSYASSEATDIATHFQQTHLATEN